MSKPDSFFRRLPSLMGFSAQQVLEHALADVETDSGRRASS